MSYKEADGDLPLSQRKTLGQEAIPREQQGMRQAFLDSVSLTSAAHVLARIGPQRHVTTLKCSCH